MGILIGLRATRGPRRPGRTDKSVELPRQPSSNRAGKVFGVV
jgi:hypothetical protein